MPRPALAHSLPPLVSDLFAPLPRLPIEVLLSELIRRLVARRPDLQCRLGAVAQVPIAIVPDDLPHAFLLSLHPKKPSVKICAKAALSSADAVVRAPLLDLLGVLDGTCDGDALFSSRDLRIEGRTEYVLALRNTLEDAELTPGEFRGLPGSTARWVTPVGTKMRDTAPHVAAPSYGGAAIGGGKH